MHTNVLVQIPIKDAKVYSSTFGNGIITGYDATTLKVDWNYFIQEGSYKFPTTNIYFVNEEDVLLQETYFKFPEGCKVQETGGSDIIVEYKEKYPFWTPVGIASAYGAGFLYKDGEWAKHLQQYHKGDIVQIKAPKGLQYGVVIKIESVKSEFCYTIYCIDGLRRTFFAHELELIKISFFSGLEAESVRYSVRSHAFYVTLSKDTKIGDFVIRSKAGGRWEDQDLLAKVTEFVGCNLVLDATHLSNKETKSWSSNYHSPVKAYFLPNTNTKTNEKDNNTTDNTEQKQTKALVVQKSYFKISTGISRGGAGVKGTTDKIKLGGYNSNHEARLSCSQT